jgi:Arc/MetJ family transcription regulator
MRTTVALNDDLVKKAFKYSKARTKKELIHEALEELVSVRQRRDIQELKGKVHFVEQYDYKKLRRGV